MHREYCKWFSPHLGRDMELLVFGHAGEPLIVFPTSMGRFWDWEERQMTAAVAHRLENGSLQAFCLDSVDAESWYNKSVAPAQRAARHAQYDAYLRHEAAPFLLGRNGARRISVTGCSFGGYHAVNFGLRYPELTGRIISLGGAFDIKQFINGYYDENCYFHNPPDYLPGLTDNKYLDQYRNHMQIVLATGETDICLAENRRLSAILDGKGIGHWLDVWGDGAGHDWPWWRDMARKFLG